MFIFAGLIGLMAAGAAAMVVFDSGVEEDEDLGLEETSEQDTSGTDDLLDSVTVEDLSPDPFAEEDQIIAGSDQGEVVDGGTGDDQINGYEGNDTIHGLEGDDHLYGQDGNDDLSGDAGNDVLHGEDGEDTLSGGAGADSLFGHMGDDLLDGGEGDDSLTGGFGDDSLSGGAGDDAMHGGYGNDEMHAGDGSDTLFGGYGDDVLSGVGDTPESGPDFLNGGAGDDTITAGAGDWVTSGDGHDLILLDNWPSEGDAVRIVDFNGLEDSLVLLYDGTSGVEPSVELREDPDTPDQSDLYVEGQLVASIQCGAGLTTADIVLLAQEAAPVAAP